MSKKDMTKSQLDAFKGLTDFIKTPVDPKDINTKIAILTGKAGTGKTWLIQNVLKELYEHDKGISGEDTGMEGLFTPNVVGVAFTHKAKNVLGKGIPMVSTFAKFYGMREDYEDDGDVIFTINRKSAENSLSRSAVKVIAHDECSMHSESMVNIANKHTHAKSKIIYIGDPGQLPPVEKNRKNSDKDSLTFVSSPRLYHLGERVRQTEGNPIIDLSDEVYGEIFGSQDIIKVLMALGKTKVSDSFGYEIISKEDAVKKYLDVADDYKESKFITYKNKTLKSWNNEIRSSIYDTSNTRFIEGELIYMNKGYRSPRGDFNLHNSSEYTVKGYADSTVTVLGHHINSIKCYNVFIDKEEVENCPPNVTPYIPILNPIDYNKFLQVKKDKLDQALRNNDNRKDRGKFWGFYYDFLNSFGSISYGYAFTGHKAQGSGYENVFLDVGDMFSVPISNKRKLQALYTGITRTSQNLYLVQ